MEGIAAVTANLKSQNALLFQQQQSSAARDSRIVDVLEDVYSTLQKQMRVLEDVKELQGKTLQNTMPKDFQQSDESLTLRQEERQTSLLESILKALDGGLGFGGGGGFGILDALGITKIFDGLKSIGGKLLGLFGGLVTAIGPLVLKFGGLAVGITGLLLALEKVGSWFRNLTGMPSMDQDAFNMNRDLRRIAPNYEEPDISPEEEPPYAPSTRSARPERGGEFRIKKLAPKLQDTSTDILQKSMGISKQQYDVFRGSIAKIESKGGEYGIMGGSSNRFAGAYQMGSEEIKSSAKALGIPPPSRKEFLSDPQLQERLFDKYTEMHHKHLLKNKTYASMSKEEQLEVLGYAHNQGAGDYKGKGAGAWLRTGKPGKDAFGTSGTRYSSEIRKNLSSLKSGELKYNNEQTPNLSKEPTEPESSPEKLTKKDIGTISPEDYPKKSNMEMFDASGMQGAKSKIFTERFNKLNPEFAGRLAGLAKDYEKATGKKVGNIAPSDMYRTYGEQVAAKQNATAKGRPGNAATPGYSAHGLGMAVDFGTAESRWAAKTIDPETGKTYAEKWGVHAVTPGQGGKIEPWHLTPRELSVKEMNRIQTQKGIAGKSGVLSGAEVASASGTELENIALKRAGVTPERTSYAKLEKEVPENKREEESEMEESDEQILKEKDYLTPYKEDLQETTKDSLKTSEDGYSDYFSQMISLLSSISEKMSNLKQDDKEEKKEEDSEEEGEEQTEESEEDKLLKENGIEPLGDKIKKETPTLGPDPEDFGTPPILENPTVKKEEDSGIWKGIKDFFGFGDEKTAEKVSPQGATESNSLVPSNYGSTGYQQGGFPNIYNVMGTGAQVAGSVYSMKNARMPSNGMYAAQGAIGAMGSVMRGMPGGMGKMGNVLGAIPQIMGGIGSMQNMGNNPMGSVYGIQRAIGGIQGALGGIFGPSQQQGQRNYPYQTGPSNSNMGSFGNPAYDLGGITPSSSIGGIFGIPSNQNMTGGYGFGAQQQTGINGALTGIGRTLGAAPQIMSGVMSAQNMSNNPFGAMYGIQNAVGGVQGALGGITQVGSAIGKGISSIFGGEDSSTQPAQKRIGSSLESSPSDYSAGAGVEPSQKKIGSSLGSGSIADMGIGSDAAAINQKYAGLSTAPKFSGNSLEAATTSVQAGKEEMSFSGGSSESSGGMESSGGGSPSPMPSGGTGGGGGSAPKGVGDANPSSGSAMGIGDLSCRNTEDPALYTAMFGQLRIV